MRFSRLVLVVFALIKLGLQHDLQTCRYITIPVCGEDQVSTSLSDLTSYGARGPVGHPGKMGPPGLPGRRGDAGPPGRNVNPIEIEKLVERKVGEMKNKLLKMSGADFCRTASEGVHLVNGDLFLCDGKGWTVIQHRRDGSIDFERKWIDYRYGFGSLDGEFWIGLQTLHKLTRERQCKLRVDLKDFDQERAYAEYSRFAVEDEGKNFRLSISGYNGTAGDSMAFSDGMMFTTIDKDNDRYTNNCAEKHGGWWFKNCYRASLNAPWGRTSGRWSKIIWYTWRGESNSMDSTTMSIYCE